MGNDLAKVNNLNQYLALPGVSGRLSEKLGLEEGKKFAAALSSALSTNPVLMTGCTPDSVINVGLLGHSMNLPPSPQLGYYYFVPFGRKGQDLKQATFVMGYKGYIQLAMRSGYYTKLVVSDVKEGEFVSWNPLSEELTVNFITDPIKRDKAKAVGYCGFFEYMNGFRKMTYWTLEAIQLHADKYSPAYSLANDKLLKAGKIPQKDLWKFSSFWYKDFDIMAKKTVIRSMLSRWGAMSVDMQRAYEQDLKSEDVSFEVAQITTSEQNHAEAGSEVVDAKLEPEKPQCLKWLCNECGKEFARRKDEKCPGCGSANLLDQHAKPAAKPDAPNEDFLT